MQLLKLEYTFSLFYFFELLKNFICVKIVNNLIVTLYDYYFIFQIITFELDLPKMQKKEFQIKLGEKLAELRKEKKLSQVDLGHLLEKEKQNINRIERGKTNVTAFYLLEFSTKLQIPLFRVFDFEDKLKDL